MVSFLYPMNLYELLQIFHHNLYTFRINNSEHLIPVFIQNICIIHGQDIFETTLLCYFLWCYICVNNVAVTLNPYFDSIKSLQNNVISEIKFNKVSLCIAQIWPLNSGFTASPRALGRMFLKYLFSIISVLEKIFDLRPARFFKTKGEDWIIYKSSLRTWKFSFNII